MIVENAFYHWPTLPHELPFSMTERELLGYPDTFVQHRLMRTPQDVRARMASYDSDGLLNILESPLINIDDRIVAGNVLAMRDDPRFLATTPEMRIVTGGQVLIGIDVSDVAKVVREYHGLGIHPSWIEKEAPQHYITLKTFKMARYPVTNIEYLAFLEETKYPEIPSSWILGRYPEERSNHPVHTVSPRAAETYAQWLSDKTGRQFRLPTEAEWEHAAAGHERCIFPWGNSFEPDLCNTAEFGFLNTTPVGCFVEGASPFGIQDMAGNVEEFVQDDYAPYPNGPFITDHLNEDAPSYRIARGGSFARFRDLCRNTRRHGFNHRTKVYVVGFRLAENM